ncbi:MAG: hypothetical protein P1V97_24250 [Planctomycetota bacterium]|nr:hypothetical protein [Planctomycetota bacterium]
MKFFGEFQLTRKGKPFLILAESGTKIPIFASKLLCFLNSCQHVQSGGGDLIRTQAIVFGNKTRLNGRDVIHALQIKFTSANSSNWTIGVGDPPIAAFSEQTFSGFLYAEDQAVEMSLTSDFLDTVLIENYDSVFYAIQSQTCEPNTWPAYFERVSGEWTWFANSKKAVISSLLVWRGAEMYEIPIPDIFEK